MPGRAEYWCSSEPLWGTPSNLQKLQVHNSLQHPWTVRTRWHYLLDFTRTLQKKHYENISYSAREQPVERQDCVLYAKATSFHDLASFIHLRGFKAVPPLLPGRIPSPQLAFQCPKKKSVMGKTWFHLGKVTFLLADHKSDYFESLLLSYHNIYCSLSYWFQWQKDQVVDFRLVSIHISLWNLMISFIKIWILLQQKTNHRKSYRFCLMEHNSLETIHICLKVQEAAGKAGTLVWIAGPVGQYQI